MLKKLIMSGVVVTAMSTVYAEEPKSFTLPADVAQQAVSAPQVQAAQKQEKTVLISPRTGMRYSFNNPDGRPILFKVEPLAAANSQTVTRIVAENPALSPESQQQAVQNLLNLTQQK